MKNVLAVVVIASATGCASTPSPTPSVTPVSAVAAAPVRGLYARIPTEIGAFKLTEREIVRGVPSDSLFRYSDGSRTILTVIIYEVSADVRVDPDSQKWTAREGEKFRMVLDIRKTRGQIGDYVLAFSDTTRVPMGTGKILEHSIAAPIRFPNGNVAVDMQYLYLIDGRFVKVRATIPGQGWEQTQVPSFARELAQRMAKGN